MSNLQRAFTNTFPKTYVCRVCNDVYRDSVDHYEDHYDEVHKKYEFLVRMGQQDTCYCGGDIIRSMNGPESYTIYCNDCEFIFDED